MNLKRHSLCAAIGEVLRFRSTTELRQWLADVAPVPGQREGAVDPLRVPFTLTRQW